MAAPFVVAKPHGTSWTRRRADPSAVGTSGPPCGRRRGHSAGVRQQIGGPGLGDPPPRRPPRTAAERLGDERQSPLHGGPEVGLNNAQLGPFLSNPLVRRSSDRPAWTGVRVLEEAGLVPHPDAGVLLLRRITRTVEPPTPDGPVPASYPWPGRGCGAGSGPAQSPSCSAPARTRGRSHRRSRPLPSPPRRGQACHGRLAPSRAVTGTVR